VLEHSCAPAHAQVVAHPALKKPRGENGRWMERPLGRGARGARGEYILGFLSFLENRAPPHMPADHENPGGSVETPPGASRGCALGIPAGGEERGHSCDRGATCPFSPEEGGGCRAGIPLGGGASI
jgi:hypothetical protein